MTGNGGKCIATAGGSNANGTSLQINACSSGGSQLYTVANNRLVVLGKCVQAMGTTAGSAVQTQNCDNSAAQTWTPRADGTLHNPAANRCLAIPGDVTTSNTVLVLGDCASTVPAGQKWTVPNTTTTYLYDADGNQLIRRNPGTNTINLGTDELTVDTTTKAQTGTRYYPVPGGLTIVRKGAGTAPGSFVVQAVDHHGTGTVSIDLTTSAATRRPTDPFGNPRGNQPAPGSWLGDKGFVGGTKDDTTGLTNLGARQYQPTTGRFISPDPVLDQSSPQQWNGYAYSNNNPVDRSDPNGLKSEECGTLYQCGSAGTITMKNAAETTANRVPENVIQRQIESTSYRYVGIVSDSLEIAEMKKRARRNYGLDQLDKYKAKTRYPYKWDANGKHKLEKGPDDVAAPAEIKLCGDRPVECAGAFAIKLQADDLRHKEFPEIPMNTDTDETNAFHHAVWQALLAYNYGSDSAWEWADAHEAFHAKKDQKDHIADLVNNVKGRAIGEEARKKFGQGPFLSADNIQKQQDATNFIVDMARKYLADGDYARRSDFDDWERG
ncbi:ricin-type beta-trefoil lectin domain protein [Kitasatospora sp. NPDC092286]|uniref:ricin-type beta-trefoil lectin domain protein n=1 Tax=Kitasatospora sp. NPDC092286 TaxID=3364087 RepID=UPI0038107209